MLISFNEFTVVALFGFPPECSGICWLYSSDKTVAICGLNYKILLVTVVLWRSSGVTHIETWQRVKVHPRDLFSLCHRWVWQSTLNQTIFNIFDIHSACEQSTHKRQCKVSNQYIILITSHIGNQVKSIHFTSYKTYSLFVSFLSTHSACYERTVLGREWDKQGWLRSWDSF